MSDHGSRAITAGLVLFLTSGAAGDSLPDAKPAAQPPPFTLCDLVEEALLASAPKPGPHVDSDERRQRRARIERIRERVQQLRDADRCG